MPFGGYMSLVIYKDGTLVGDNRGSRYIAAFGMIREIKKVHKSKCGRIALGVTGSVFTPDELQIAFEFLLNAVIDHHYRHADLDYTGQFKPEVGERIGMSHRQFIVMTATHVFAVEDNRLIDVTREPWYCSGNGVIMADIFLNHGLSPQKTIEAVAKLSSEVGSRFNVAQQHTLKPLIKEVAS